MPKMIGGYKNGNYFVELYQDGTKIRQSMDGTFVPAFAESCDVTITKKCDGGCPFCYVNCTPDGKHAELLNNEFLDTLHPFTEMAINGNDLSHPQLEEFLTLLKSKKVIANITVNQKHFLQHLDKLLDWQNRGLFAGLGISYNAPTTGFVGKVKMFPNAVVHTIAGVLDGYDIEYLGNRGLKLLILGYKFKGRGLDFGNNNFDKIMNNIKCITKNLNDIFNKFEVVSFDNLALEQLRVGNLLSPRIWEEVYMGDEGSSTFYIDLVNQTFARSSLDTEEFPMMDSIDDMFQFIRNKYITR